MSDREAAVRAALERELGQTVGDLEKSSVGGGSINSAARIRCGQHSFFLKWNSRALPRHFESEAEGLRALEAAESGFWVPRVIAFADGDAAYLLLSDLGETAPRKDYDEAFGRALACLHRRSDQRGYGFEFDGYCGATPQPNAWTKSWLEFYRDQRLGHMVELAERRGLGDVAALRILIDRLDRWIIEPERSSLIHGDLWSGNAHVGPDGGPAILDPAAYFAHREAELGMMSLFGGFAQRVWDSYRESFPLHDGWEDRIPLYELYHVLNHFVLFGGGYGAQARRIALRYVS